MANPKTLSWTQPALNEDGSVFDATQFRAFGIFIDTAPALDIPIAWSTSGAYSIPLASIAALQAPGTHTIKMVTQHKNGLISAPSAPLTFVMADERVPKSPLALAVS